MPGEAGTERLLEEACGARQRTCAEAASGLGRHGLREVGGLELDLEIQTVDFGFDQWLSLKSLLSKKMEKILSVWDTEAPPECSGEVAEPENSGGTEGRANSHSGPGRVRQSLKEQPTPAGQVGISTTPSLRDP